MITIALLSLCAPAFQNDGQSASDPPYRGWLLEHQDADGRWDADGFSKHDAPGDAEGDPGRPEFDVAATSLALWAMLGDGHTLSKGPFRAQFARGVRWLLRTQDLDTGWIREQEHELALRHHAWATIVLCESQFFTPGPLLEDACLLAVELLVRTQQGGGAWGDGDAAASARTTAWAVFALHAAREAGLEPHTEALARGLAWLRKHADERGVLPQAADNATADLAATGLGVLCRMLDGEEAERFVAAGELLVERVARIDEEHSPDAETWFVAAVASYQLGGPIWRDFNGHMKRHVVMTQGKGNGSWSAPGEPGGRVVQTAWNILSLEMYFRYARLLGAR